MEWRFSILKRGSQFLIDQPTGWDSIEIDITRDKDKHGVFFDYTTNDFQFDGKALKILKDEYDNYGVEGNCILIIEQNCGGSFEELYRGRFDFSQYKYISGSECYISCPIETTSDVMTFNNRFDQDVDLESTVAFDESTELPSYSALGNKILFKAKGIPLFNETDNKLANSHNFQSGLQDPTESNNNQFTNTQIGIGGDTEVYTEIGSFSGSLSDDTTTVDDNTTLSAQSGFPIVPGNDARFRPYYGGAFFSYESGSTNFQQINGPVSLDIHITGNIKVGKCSIADIAIVLCRYNLDNRNLDNFGNFVVDYDILETWNVFYDHQDESQRLQEGAVVPFDIFYSNADIRENGVIPTGQYYWLQFGIFDHKTADQISELEADDSLYAYQINYDAGGYIKMYNLSYGGTNTQSSIKTFLANESLSRVTEAITNDALRVYSDYFGRTDSLPYATDVDGCGSLEVITNGLFLRRIDETKTDTPPILSISMKDLFDGLDCIHHLGMGIEDDPERAGYKRVRIEKWDFFYNTDIILSCDNIADITKETVAEEHYSTFEIGYSTWQAQDFSGLDEFLSNRTYRTSLSTVQNDLNKESKFIASGYAIEATRRKGNTTSEDYTFDNNIFIVCVKRSGTDMIPEQGNISNPENLIDPSTIMNFRISPIRNALRWAPTLFGSYKKQNEDTKLIFTSGEGNFYANGKLSDGCIIEASTIEENETIDISKFDDSTEAFPVTSPERVSFTYPLSVKEFKSLLSNPNGLIQYMSSVESGYGWIDEIKYKPQEGTADFTLIPKYE